MEFGRELLFWAAVLNPKSVGQLIRALLVSACLCVIWWLDAADEPPFAPCGSCL